MSAHDVDNPSTFVSFSQTDRLILRQRLANHRAGLEPGRHRVGSLCHWRWVETGRVSSFGSLAALPVRINGRPR